MQNFANFFFLADPWCSVEKKQLLPHCNGLPKNTSVLICSGVSVSIGSRTSLQSPLFWCQPTKSLWSVYLAFVSHSKESFLSHLIKRKSGHILTTGQLFAPLIINIFLLTPLSCFNVCAAVVDLHSKESVSSSFHDMEKWNQDEQHLELWRRKYSFYGKK